jgi:hypothetical protein
LMMVLTGDIIRLTEDTIRLAPARKGVYALYRGNELIYIGKAEQEGGLKAKLLVHLLSNNACTRNATSYRFEACDNPQEREEMLLQAYKTSYYRLPRCNVMMG